MDSSVLLSERGEQVRRFLASCDADIGEDHLRASLTKGRRGRPTATVPVLATVADGDWGQDAAERVAAADWEAIETVSVELGECFFAPDLFTLQVGQTYKLGLKNAGRPGAAAGAHGAGATSRAGAMA